MKDRWGTRSRPARPFQVRQIDELIPDGDEGPRERAVQEPFHPQVRAPGNPVLRGRPRRLVRPQRLQAGHFDLAIRNRPGPPPGPQAAPSHPRRDTLLFWGYMAVVLVAGIVGSMTGRDTHPIWGYLAVGSGVGLAGVMMGSYSQSKRLRGTL